MDIAFITVNYNTRNLLEDLVSFFHSTRFPFSYCFVVVDNNSTDGSAELLADTRGIVHIQNQDNVGYGSAVNQGIAVTDSKYVCVLNTDLILNRETLVALWEYLESLPTVDLACPLICSPGTLQVQHFIFHESLIELYVDTVFRWMGRMLKRKLMRAKTPMAVEGIMGPFIFLRRRLIKDNKLFDESFNFYYEDNDLAHRLKERGTTCVVLPQQRIIHLGGQSSSILSTNLVFLVNRYKYLAKHYGTGHAKNIFRMEFVRAWMRMQKYRIRFLFLRRESDAGKIEAIRESCSALMRIIEPV